VARDRKRAKQRQQQRRAHQGGAARDTQPVRQNVPGALQHASGEVDEFDAALVRGARPADVPVGDAPRTAGDAPPTDDARDGEGQAAVRASGGEGQAGGGDVAQPASHDQLVDPPSDALEVGEDVGAAGEPEAERMPARRRGAGADRPRGNRALAFMRASWAELQRVQWPDRRQVAQATAVVLGFVVVAGAYLGIADLVAKKIVDAIL